MAHSFTLTVEVELERIEGKFASRDEMEEAIFDALQDANPSEISGIGPDGNTTYEVSGWEVTT